MNRGLNRVCVTGTGSFLPNEPIPNDRIDDILGPLNDAPARVQTFIKNVGARMLAGGGVEYRHFAIDPETHRLTHTLASLAEEAARRALQAAGRKPDEIDLLAFSAPTYDESTPPTSTLLQERLGIEQCAEMEIHSNCSGVGKSVQLAYDALRLGRYKTALIAHSQLSSVYMRNCYFNQSVMTKSQAALRYILADGSGALVLEAVEGEGGDPLPHEVLGTFVESVGGKRQPGMTAGGGVNDLIECESQIEGMFEKGTHHLDQDFSAVGRDAGPFLVNGVLRMLESLNIEPASVDHFVWSIPGLQLYNDYIEKAAERLSSSVDKMKFRAQKTGYCGGSSILLHFDEMARAGELQPGQTAVVHSVESSKWMSAGFVVRW
jgi:3-oxoacyl-[acyl-carrier-protein] synthase-3